MKKENFKLLLSKDETYLVKFSGKTFNTKNGFIKIDELKKKNFGDKIKTHLGKEFLIVQPTLLDFLKKVIKRSAQVILPKDASMILAYTGVKPDSLVLDAGTGTGYLAIFLANYLALGKVVTFETNKIFYQIAKENIKKIGLTNISIKRKDVSRGFGIKNADLITLDLQNLKKVIPHAYKSLKSGGWLVIYSPTINSLVEARKEIKKKNFCEVKTVENIVREWQFEKTLRPKTMGIIHTGFLTFARKLS